MKTYQDYKKVADKIDAVAKELKISSLSDDMCINIENAGTDDDYELLIICAIARFSMNCENYGLDASKFGF